MSESTPAKPGPSKPASMARFALEITAALAFLAFAAETYAHRSFSESPRYKAVVTAFAILAGMLGMLPILAHLSPKVGRLAAILWLASLFTLLLVGFVTKP